MIKGSIQVLFVSAVTAIVLSLSGCAGVRAPFVPPVGAAFTQIKAPLDVDFNKTELAGANKGTSSAINILWLFAFGDASSKAAAEDGRISTIVHADYEYFNILGIFQKTTVIVYGK